MSLMFVNEFKNSYAWCKEVKTKSAASLSAVSKKRTIKKTPRPRNAFMLYRQAMYTCIIATHDDLHNKEISRIAGAWWRNESEEVRNYYRRMADEEKVSHSLKHPDYKYQPQQKKRQRSETLSPTPSAHKKVKMSEKEHEAEDTLSWTESDISLPLEPFSAQTFDYQELNCSIPPSQYLDTAILDSFIDAIQYYDTSYLTDDYLSSLIVA